MKVHGECGCKPTGIFSATALGRGRGSCHTLGRLSVIISPGEEWGTVPIRMKGVETSLFSSPGFEPVLSSPYV